MSWHAGAAIRKLPGAWVYSTGDNAKKKSKNAYSNVERRRDKEDARKLANSRNHALKLFSIYCSFWYDKRNIVILNHPRW